MGRLRHEDGSYWTGWQYVNQDHFPAERSGWTSAAVVLAADALTGFSGGAGVFRAIPGPGQLPPARRPRRLRLRADHGGRAHRPGLAWAGRRKLADRASRPRRRGWPG